MSIGFDTFYKTNNKRNETRRCYVSGRNMRTRKI